MAIFFVNKLLGQDNKALFLIGATSYGHYQIEMACATCHTDAFGGSDVLQNACVQCHGDELEEAHDSHPKAKFTDPRNADRLDRLDARYCINCHSEHQRENTHAMGVSIAQDYCYLCHQDLAEERPSHAGLEFASCATSGCHNFHDNRALYEDFLVENAHQPWQFKPAEDWLLRPPASAKLDRHPSLTITASAFSNAIQESPTTAEEWQHSSHAQAGVDCGACHIGKDDLQWLEQPTLEQCKTCHEQETNQFTKGKHGMRLSGELSASLSAMTPGQSPMAFKADAEHLQQGCNSCHGAHAFNPSQAAVDSCLSCHNDEHSLAYVNSPHGIQWQAENTNPAAVTCATCHMPRRKEHLDGEVIYRVEHNQNWNLRPNEKMIRETCMNCHSLEFAIDALADPALIKNNFKGRPAVHIESIDWALKRAETPIK